MAPDSEVADGIKALNSSASSLLIVLEKFIAILSSKDAVPATNVPQKPPEPLTVLCTAATLLKAHATKLSLLIINKPFTPSAIRTVVNDVSGTCVPAMMSAVEICRPQQYGRILHDEAKARTRRVFKELEAMMKEVLFRTASQGDSGSTGSDEKSASSRDSLTSTGVVWEACDDLIKLKSLGLVGLVVQKAQQYRDLLQDAANELKEWAEEAEDEGFDEEDDGLSDGEDSITQMLTATNKFPKDREDIKKVLDAALQRMRLIGSLYQAIITKRLKTVDVTQPTHVSQVDLMMKVMKRIPAQADHLAEVLYELDVDAARKVLNELFGSAKEIVKISRLDWNSKIDSFTVWCDKWGAILEKT